MVPDLNRIKVFYYIFTFRSVALAAKELNISPSAVSQALTKLETELKAFLFTRLHRKLVPTSAGEQLYEIVSPFIQNLEAGIESMQKARQIPSGLLKVGAPIEFGKSYFPKIFALFRKTYPEVVFSMKLGDPFQLFPMIAGGELDFGLVDTFHTQDQAFGDLTRYSIEPLIAEKVVLACSNDYYQQEIHGDHSFENLSKKEFISYEKSSFTLRNWFKHHFNRYSVDLNRVMTVDSHQTVINGIKQHLGMGVIAAHIVRNDIRRGIIVPVQTSEADVINKIALVQLQDKIPTLTEKIFIQFLKQDIQPSGSALRFLTHD